MPSKLYKQIVVLLLALGTIAAETKSEHTDCYGDPLPQRAIARMGTVRRRLPGLVEACAFSRDGKTIVAAGGDFFHPASGNGAIHLFDAATGRPLRQLQQHKTDITCLAFSPDGKKLASGSADGMLCLSEWPSCKVLRQFMAHEEGIWSLAFAGTGKILASGGADKVVRLWDPSTGCEVRQYRGHTGWVRALAVSPDGRMIASTDDSSSNKVRLWDSANGRLLHQHNADTHWGQSLAFSPDNKLVAYPVERSMIALWDVESRKLARELRGKQNDSISAVAFSPDGRTVAAGASDHSLVLWDAATGKILHQLPGRNTARYPGGITCLAFSPDGSRLVFGESRRLKVWDVRAWREVQPDGEYTNLIDRVLFSGENNTLITAASDRIDALREWEVVSGRKKRTLWHESLLEAHGFQLSPDHAVLTIAEDHEKALLVRSQNTITGKEIRRVKMPIPKQMFGRGPGIISPDGKIIIADLCDKFRLPIPLVLYDTRTGKELDRITCDHYRELFSPDSGTLALASNRDVDESVTGLRRYIGLYNVAKGQIVREWPLSEEHDFIRSMVFSLNSRLLAVACSDSDRPNAKHQLNVRETTTGKKRAAELASRTPLVALAFSPDGSVLAAGDTDGVIHLWSMAAGKEILHLPGHRGGIESLAFSHDGKLLASGSTDTTALIWDIREAAEAARPRVAEVSREQLERLWADLGDNEGGRVHRAIWGLVAARPAMPWLREHLKPIPPADAQRIARLIADLDSDSFAVREKATRELQAMTETAEPALRKALANKPSLELRRRVEPMVKNLENWPASRAALRDWRALEVLEYLGTPEAQQVLQKLADGSPQARLTREAKAALQRLAARRDTMP